MKVSKNRNNVLRDFLGCRFSKLTHNGSQAGDSGGIIFTSLSPENKDN